MKRYFEYIDGNSSKFWQIELIDNRIYKTYGKIGSKGTTKEHVHYYYVNKEFEIDRECRKKTTKGYIEKHINTINNDKSLNHLINNFRKLL